MPPGALFEKILIANRGEIAVRVGRACRELGIRSVAVYSEPDAGALHVRLADEAQPIGPAPAAQSYLSIERLLEAARRSGAQAVHPGYGFLSENAAFAQAVQEAGLVFIGPPAQAIRAMGDKAAARARMQQAGVPVVPGYQGPDELTALAQAAEQIGYPVLAKAAAGGGGRGMRVVAQPADLAESLAAARREALHAFGDGRLILEKYLAGAHHVEFQVLGDQHGRLVHLFERECSVQRRHQKIIEESPSPLLGPELRRRMGADAVRAAQAAGYFNAGTIEFILDPASRSYYFLEMNTRLQVEHPVTELVTGLDLVQWQIRIAAGEPFPYTQEQLEQRGHAIECRLYAEDPANHFLPAAGRLLYLDEPQGPGIRLDAGAASGDEVTIHYDPLLAKLICFAEDRPSAIRRMQAALGGLAALGLTTNAAFLGEVLAAPEFLAGQVHTTWVDERFAGWQPAAPEALPPGVLAAAALSQRRPHLPGPAEGGPSEGGPSEGGPLKTLDPYSPWQPAAAGAVPRSPARSPAASQTGALSCAWQWGGQTYTVTLEPRPSGWRLTGGSPLGGAADPLDGPDPLDGKPLDFELLGETPGPGRSGVLFVRLGAANLGAANLRVAWAEEGERLYLASGGQTYVLERNIAAARPSSRRGAGSHADPASAGLLRAPMPAQVRSIQVAPGESFSRGQTLLVLEAMKMEIRLQAPTAGRVLQVLAAVGQQVNRDQVLVEIEPEG